MMRGFLDRLAERGMPWRYGTDRPEDLLEPDWHAEVSLFSTVGTALGRWPGPDAPRDTPGVPQIFLVHAALA
jgi:hypothetical protein